jgi:hypothetical protein
MTPHPETIRSIKARGISFARHGATGYQCDCLDWGNPDGWGGDPEGWELCPYHRGYNDACEALDRTLGGTDQ